MCFMIKNLRNGTSWISIDDWYVFLYAVDFFFLPKEHPNMFFLGIQNICDLLQI